MNTKVIDEVRNLKDSKETLPTHTPKELLKFWRDFDKYLEIGKKLAEKERLKF